MVRERSGLQGVKESWDQYVGNSKYATQTGLRQIIMQERRIELAFEGHYFGMSVGGNCDNRIDTAIDRLESPLWRN